MNSRMWSAPAIALVAALMLLSSAGGATAGALITGKQIKNGSVTGADIEDGSLTGRDVRDRSVGRSDLAASSVDSSKVADGTVGMADLSQSVLDALRPSDAVQVNYIRRITPVTSVAYAPHTAMCPADTKIVSGFVVEATAGYSLGGTLEPDRNGFTFRAASEDGTERSVTSMLVCLGNVS